MILKYLFQTEPKEYVKYNPRCKYCNKVNIISLHLPLNYLYCCFNCNNCRYHNMKKIRYNK